MTREEAIARLHAAESQSSDAEGAHNLADAVLCEFLQSLGYADVVEAWIEVPKWYA